MGTQTAALRVGAGACRWIQRWRDLGASHCSPNQAEGARSARPRIGGEDEENCLDYSLGLRMLLNARILLCLSGSESCINPTQVLVLDHLGAVREKSMPCILASTQSLLRSLAPQEMHHKEVTKRATTRFLEIGG